MSWVEGVPHTCCRSQFHEWRILGGVWICECGQPMTMSQIATYHAGLDRLKAVSGASTRREE